MKRTIIGGIIMLSGVRLSTAGVRRESGTLAEIGQECSTFANCEGLHL